MADVEVCVSRALIHPSIHPSQKKCNFIRFISVEDEILHHGHFFNYYSLLIILF